MFVDDINHSYVTLFNLLFELFNINTKYASDSVRLYSILSVHFFGGQWQ